MLRSLHIENIAVIRRADLELERGFSVLTGETGAGKSMLIDGINLLLGNRVSRELIRSGEEEARVSAVFESLSDRTLQKLSEMGFSCPDGTLMLCRTLRADGKGRTTLDGQTITQTVQREIARMLVSIHGQNDNQKLMQKGAYLELLDAYAHTETQMAEYRNAYRQWKETGKKLQEISRDEAEKLRLREMLQYQIADIDALRLKEGEETALRTERDRLSNLEKINHQIGICCRALRNGEKSDAYALVRRAQNALNGLGALIPEADALVERLDAVASEIEDISALAEGYADDDREDPTERIDRIEGRLDAIAKLKRKYGNGIPEILAFRNRAAERLALMEDADETAARLEQQLKTDLKNAKTAAERLSEARRKAAEQITGAVIDALRYLDMPKMRFEIRLQTADLTETGADSAEFLIAVNPGEPLLPLEKTASGGELSRIMLALRSVLNDRDGVDTVIFDEVDTGISGKTSRKVGIKLHESAEKSQVLCVTHSAQIASLADTHYLIRKNERDGRAETEIRKLDGEERVEEIARILGGIRVTDAARDAAREMIEEYRTKNAESALSE